MRLHALGHMAKNLSNYVGFRCSAEMKRRLKKVAQNKKAALSKVHGQLEVNESDIVRDCVLAHLPKLEAQYGIVSPEDDPGIIALRETR